VTRAAALAGAVLLLLACALARPAFAASRERDLGTGLESDVRDLDGAQFLVDEPVWLCTDPAYAPAPMLPSFLPHRYELRGTDAQGHRIRARRTPVQREDAADEASGTSTPRAGEFGFTFGFHDPSGRAPLLAFANGIPAGAWEVHHANAPDSGRVLARFRVVEPRGSERFVRDALARAARLAGPRGEGARAGDAARLYDAILRRYPRTAYLSVVYAGLWFTRAHDRFGDDPDRWLEEIFARFHDTCFGTAALDAWVRDMGPARAKKTVARLVGIYPDTPLSRAARRYL